MEAREAANTLQLTGCPLKESSGLDVRGAKLQNSNLEKLGLNNGPPLSQSLKKSLGSTAPLYPHCGTGHMATVSCGGKTQGWISEAQAREFPDIPPLAGVEGPVLEGFSVRRPGEPAFCPSPAHVGSLLVTWNLPASFHE